MTIITTRRISQTFFFLLFVWFCLVATLGSGYWQLRGWPVNWFLQLDPLAGLGLLLATHTFYAGLLWGLVTIVSTVFLGRCFCGWICPMGTLQQVVGYLGQRGRKVGEQISVNQPHGGRHLKYWLLIFLLTAAAADMLHFLFASPWEQARFFWTLVLLATLWAGLMVVFGFLRLKPAVIFAVIGFMVVGAWFHGQFGQSDWLAASLQTGLLDPIALIHRSFNLVLLPLMDSPLQATAVIPRFYHGAGLIGMLFVAILVLCLRVPRFYCRFVCPLGALLGLLSRWAVWRIGKSEERCRQCSRCEAHCEGACSPGAVIQINECVLCLNCMHQCRHKVVGYRPHPSSAGERLTPDLGRRQVVSALVGGLALAPVLRLDGRLAGTWDPQLIRPPGALGESDFLNRCIKCGQCMRVCPTNVIHPAAWQAGLEGLWTPVLNFRAGTSGCQHNCVACSRICPTAALRPLVVDERLGRGRYAEQGPIRTGTAFIERGRCLPWAMDTPCIVCQENCPVSPKAIFTRTEYRTVRDGEGVVRSIKNELIEVGVVQLKTLNLAGGDYYLQWKDSNPVLIIASAPPFVSGAAAVKSGDLPAIGDICRIQVRLQLPFVDARRCIGCGVCEHECPIQGRRAVRVSAENESRHARHRMVL